ncbi:ABC transporter ATP-binding protein [Peribacillus alkalitolerans]|uniref:ABC transporter ATP-binding protein n=1 Tax=Peribacillus alkalitolerans TaxID=1550385 RepID=UPI0013CF5EC5|nr:ABC transporter ATP-binding protein [Peribacillus alkalitolerans]
MNTKLILHNITKVYEDGDHAVTVLDGVNLQVRAGEFVAVVGPSGSGKSTFLSIAGALLSPTSGKIIVGDHDISRLSPQRMNQIRLKNLGFIFQSSNLIPYLTVRDQLLLISELAGVRSKQNEQLADDLIERLGLKHRRNHYPEHLSGGERQRVAIARALMNDPELILADEPTASLDAERGRDVVELLANEVKLNKKAAVMVTHDKRVLDLCDRIVYMENGRLIEK